MRAGQSCKYTTLAESNVSHMCSPSALTLLRVPMGPGRVEYVGWLSEPVKASGHACVECVSKLHELITLWAMCGSSVHPGCVTRTYLEAVHGLNRQVFQPKPDISSGPVRAPFVHGLYPPMQL